LLVVRSVKHAKAGFSVACGAEMAEKTREQKIRARRTKEAGAHEVTVAQLDQRLDRIERMLEDLARNQQRWDSTILKLAPAQLHRRLQAIVRALYLKPNDLDYPHRLTVQRFGLLSQFEEDGLTLAVLREAGMSTSKFVDIGCGENGGNSGFLVQELGWSGLMVDADEDRVAASRLRFPRGVDVVREWVTRERINDLLIDRGISGEIDLLSIDIDGNDYWIWKAIEAVDPRLVIVEANLLFGGDRAVVVPYDPNFSRHGLSPTYYGASLSALTVLGREKGRGYRLIALEPNGPNAYFLRSDLAPHIPGVPAADVHRHLQKLTIKRQLSRGEVGDPVGELYEYIEAQGLPLVEVG
jgi:hypothetical protein